MPQSPSQADKLAPGTVLGGRYRVEAHIGSGGYASVYRAIDLQARHDAERAIKEVTDSDAGVRRQFQLEAGLLIKSSHPNIPHGYQLFEERGRLYLVMEFVRGRDLEDWLNESLQKRRRPLDEEQVLRWAIEVCGALQEMHEREVPIIHRDIKPANIKITPEQKPVLIDFGLAKLQTGGPTRTAAQGVSPGFAPPEQYMAKGRTDARTDIYGLGATLYACLTGKDPPEAPSRLLAETGATGQALISPRDMVRDGSVSETTDRIVVKMLELSPGARYQSAAELREALEQALRQRGQPQRGTLVAIICPACGRQTRADAAACQHCGHALRGNTPAAASGKRAAVAPPPPPPTPASGKQPAVSPKQGTAKHTVIAAAAPAPATGKQKRASLAPAPNPLNPPAPPSPASPAKVPSGTGKQPAAKASPPPATAVVPAARGTGKMVAAAAATSAQAVAVAVAAPSAAPRKGRTGKKANGAPAALPAPAPAIPSALALPAGPRSWINLRGPEISSLGKFGLGLSAVETCWGIFLLMLAGVEVALRGHEQKPYLLMALIWLVIIAIVCTVGGQALVRPIYRRGRLGRVRRGFQAFGLLVYALVLHAIGLWGLVVFGTGRPDSLTAIVAFVLFAVNVFVAGVLSLANTLG